MNDNMKIKYFDEELEVYDERRVVSKNTYSITLNYVPSPTRPLTVENGKTILTETNGTPNANQYVLDRENGLLLFNQAMKGKVMTINYSAIGLWCISADKVYTNVDNKGKIVETLEDLMRENRQAIESIKTIGDASTVITQLQANIDSVTGLVGNIAEGSSVNEELTKSITSGKGTNITLTNTISSANNKINEMNTWVNQHGDIVNLDNRVDTVETEIPKINEQLDNKATYFESINALKTSNKIKNNTICKTQGYYEAGDGGGAIYRITDNPALENAFSFSVAKGLTAELIYEDEINIKQLGARDYDEDGNKVDIKPYIELYINKTNNIGKQNNKKMIKLFIPSGRWFTSPLKIKSSSTYIYGVCSYSYPYSTGTMIMPMGNNQSHLWIVGDNTIENSGIEYGNINIFNLLFSTINLSKDDSIFVGGVTRDKCYKCDTLFTVSRVYGGNFENIYFTNYIGTAFKLLSSNEIIFNDFTFRNGDAFENGNIVFDTDITGNKNISACFFDKFSFEGVKGDIFNLKKNSKFINNKIGTIIFEDREVKVSKDGTFRNYTIVNDSEKTFISKSIFNIEEQEYCEINVDNILLNNFGKVVFTLDEKEYLFDTIVKENGKVTKGHVNIKNISHVGARRDTMLLNKNEYEGIGSYNFKFICENANHIDSDKYKFVINTPGSMKPYIRYKDIVYKRCIDYVSSPNVVLNKNGKVGYYMPVVTDIESITSEKLVIDNLNYKKYLSSFSSEVSCFIIPVIGNKLHIRVKTKAGFLAHCYLTENTGQKDYTVESKGESYNWYTIDFTSYRQVHLDKEMLVALRTLTADETNYVKLDVFYWE